MLPVYAMWARLGGTSPNDVDEMEVWQAAALFDEGSTDGDDADAMMEGARLLAEVGIEGFAAEGDDAWPA